MFPVLRSFRTFRKTIPKSEVLSGKPLEQGPSLVLDYLFSKLRRPASFPARCAAQNHLKQDTFLSCLSF